MIARSSGTLTTEFGHEMEAERDSWLRRRFLWYNGVMLGMLALSLVAAILGLVLTIFGGDLVKAVPGQATAQVYAIIATLVSGGLHGAAFWHGYRHGGSRATLLRMVFGIIVLGGALSLLRGAASAAQMTEGYNAKAREAARADADGRRDIGMGIRIKTDAAKEPAAVSVPDADTDSEDQAEISTLDGPRAPVASASDALILIPHWLRSALVNLGGLAHILVAHIFACFFLPWTARESVRPIIPLLALNAVITLLFMKQAPLYGTLAIAVSPLVAVPGVAVCWWRNSRFHEQFTFAALRGRYLEIKRELTDARRIHESLFPVPESRGVLHFEYLYQPMRLIGGDFVYARFDEPNPSDPANLGLSLLVVDVTGHGIPAALTVNRLFGEIERLFAENPRIEPGELLRGLNRYVYLTLTQHDQYPTAIAFRIDPAAGTVRVSSAGHPTAFIRGVDATIEDVHSTCMPLGVAEPAAFDPCPMTYRFGPGDALLAYTDGASEARDGAGREFTIGGLRRTIASCGSVAPGAWSRLLLTAVDRHRQGSPTDDTLIVEVSRPLVASPGLNSAKDPAHSLFSPAPSPMRAEQPEPT